MQITINDPRQPAGQEIALTGLDALLINGQSVDVDDDQVLMFEKKTGKKLADVIAHSKKFGGVSIPRLPEIPPANTTDTGSVPEGDN